MPQVNGTPVMACSPSEVQLKNIIFMSLVTDGHCKNDDLLQTAQYTA